MNDGNPRPGALPIPDNQGKLNTGTRFAIAKALVAGLMMKIFVPDKEVDVDQAEATSVLLNEHKDGDGKWPGEFNNKTYQIKDSKNRYWKTTLTVKELSGVEEFIKNSVNKPSTCVIVYPLLFNDPLGQKHCVYVQEYDPKSGLISCMNSDPNEQITYIPAYNPGIQFYKIMASAIEMGATTSKIMSSGPSSTGSNASENSLAKKWNLGSKIFMKIKDFKGKLLIDIRKYDLDMNEKMKETKTGISLNVSQYPELKNCIGEIDNFLNEATRQRWKWIQWDLGMKKEVKIKRQKLKVSSRNLIVFSHKKDGIEITAKQFETLKSCLTAVDNEIEQQKQHRQAPGQVQVQVMSWSYFNGENI